MKKRTTALLLALVLSLGLVACGGDGGNGGNLGGNGSLGGNMSSSNESTVESNGESVVESTTVESASPDESKTEQESTPADDSSSATVASKECGNLEITFGGISFRLGQTVASIKAAGYSVSSSDGALSQIPPRERVDVAIFGNSGDGISINVFNSSDQPASIDSCIAYYVNTFGEEDVKVDGVDIKEYKDFTFADEHFAYAELLKTTDSKRVYGTAVSNIGFEILGDSVYAELLHCADFVDLVETDPEKGAVDKDLLLACSMLDKYFDVEPYLYTEGKVANRYVYDGDGVSIRINGIEIIMNSTTTKQANADGFGIPAFGETVDGKEDMLSAHRPYSLNFIKGKVSTIEFYNPKDEPISYEDAIITGISIESDFLHSYEWTSVKQLSEEMNPWLDEFMGLNSKSTIKDLVEKLGAPDQIRSSNSLSASLTYHIDTGTFYTVTFSVDLANGRIVSLTINKG